MNLSSFSKVLVTTLLVASSSLAFAKMGYKGENFKGEAPCPPPVMLHDGFYLGAQIGYDSFRVRHDIFFNPPGPINTFSADPVLNATGWVGGLFLGYGRYLTDLFYLGAEIYGNYSDASADWSAQIGNPQFFYKSDFDVRGSWGINLVPGIRLNDTSLGYVKIGYNWARFDIDETPVFFNNNHHDNDETEHGWSFGVGIETLLWENWSVRTEYNHVSYDDFHGNRNNNAFLDSKWNPSDNQFLVGLVYHFC